MSLLTLHPALEQQNLIDVRKVIATDINSRVGHLYFWCLPATITTDSVIAENIPNLIQTTFNPGQLSANLRAGTDLIERISARRSDLVGLEERAISTFLDYQLADSIQPLNLRLSKLAVKANRVTANATEEDAGNKTLTAQDQAQTQARKLRQLLHNAPGHPLNYGERITQLREGLIELVKILLDRLIAVRVGFAHYGLGELPDVPAWSTNSSDNVFQLTQWIRAAVRLYEKGLVNREEISVFIFLGADGIFPGGQAAMKLAFATGNDLDFDFVLEEAKIAALTRHCVVSDVGVSLAFSENLNEYTAAMSGVGNSPDVRAQFSLADNWARQRREKLVMTYEVRVPEQTTRLGDGVVWKRPDVRAYSEPAFWSGSPLRSGTDASIVNGVSPYGAWHIKINKELRDIDGTQLNLSSFKTPDSPLLLSITDVVLFLRLQKWA